MPVVSYEFERRVAAPLDAVRGELLRALDTLNFKVKTSQLTVIEAERGSRLGGTTLVTKRAPLKIKLDLEHADGVCLVRGHFSDNLYTPLGVMFGVNTTYQKIFEEVQASIDAALARLDPAAAQSFAAGAFTARQATVGVLEKTNTLMASGQEAVTHRAGSMLEGGHDDGIPDSWTKIQRIRFDGPKGSHVLTMANTQAYLTVAALIADQPHSLPANLRDQLEQFAARIEHKLNEGGQGEIQLTIEDGAVPILEFMHLQSAIRGGLPIRTLHTCHDCQFEKITNPDYERLMQRNQNLRSVLGLVGVTVGTKGVSPFVIFSALFKLKRLDPDYVCPRCQGMSATESLVTFCPQCGDLRKEAVLHTCPKCQHDFRKAVGPERFWQELPPPVPEPVPVIGASAALPPATETAGKSLTSLLAAGQPLETRLSGSDNSAVNASTHSTVPPQDTATVQTGSTSDVATPLVNTQTRECPVCHAVIPADASFCIQCGARLGPQPAAPTICPNCGATLAPGAHFCGQCGTKIAEPASPATAPP